MNILIVETDLTGPDPEICALISYGYVLLDDQLNVVEEGGDMVQPQMGLYVPPDVEALSLTCKDNMMTEADFLDHMRSIAKEERTLLASRSSEQLVEVLKAVGSRHNRRMPKTVEGVPLDVRALSLATSFAGSIEKAYDKDTQSIYEIERESNKYIPRAFVDAKVTADMIGALLCSTRKIDG